MSSGIARAIGMALFLFCLGVTASPALAKSAVPTLRPRVCPRACRVQLRKDFTACKASCRQRALSAGQCRTACGEVRLEAGFRCKGAANPTPPSCD
jgi:hypothetical protein